MLNLSGKIERKRRQGEKLLSCLHFGKVFYVNALDGIHISPTPSWVDTVLTDRRATLAEIALVSA